MTNAAIILAPEKGTDFFNLGMIVPGFKAAQNKAIDAFTDRLGTKRLSTYMRGYFLARHPGFHFGPDEDDALTELMHSIRRNRASEFNIILPGKLSEYASAAHDIVMGHTKIDDNDAKFLLGLRTQQVAYKKTNGHDVTIGYAIRGNPNLSLYAQTFDAAFQTADGTSALDIVGNGTAAFGLKSKPDDMSDEQWQTSVARSLKKYAFIDSPDSALIITNCNIIEENALNNGMSVCNLNNDVSDYKELLAYTYHFLFKSKEVWSEVHGKGRSVGVSFFAPAL